MRSKETIRLISEKTMHIDKTMSIYIKYVTCIISHIGMVISNAINSHGNIRTSKWVFLTEHYGYLKNKHILSFKGKLYFDTSIHFCLKMSYHHFEFCHILSVLAIVSPYISYFYNNFKWSEVTQSCLTLRPHGLQPARLLHLGDFPD